MFFMKGLRILTISNQLVLVKKNFKIKLTQTKSAISYCEPRP